MKRNGIMIINASGVGRRRGKSGRSPRVSQRVRERDDPMGPTEPLDEI